MTDIATADVATLARVARDDCPALATQGTGFLGAGTHPAQPYLNVMLGMHGVGTVHPVRQTTYGYDTADDVILRFIGNATTWRGDTARAVKARLREMIKA